MAAYEITGIWRPLAMCEIIRAMADDCGPTIATTSFSITLKADTKKKQSNEGRLYKENYVIIATNLCSFPHLNSTDSVRFCRNSSIRSVLPRSCSNNIYFFYHLKIFFVVFSITS